MSLANQKNPVITDRVSGDITMKKYPCYFTTWNMTALAAFFVVTRQVYIPLV